MKSTAKFRRSLRYLWMESRLGPIIWIDEMVHMTDKDFYDLRQLMVDSMWAREEQGVGRAVSWIDIIESNDKFQDSGIGYYRASPEAAR